MHLAFISEHLLYKIACVHITREYRTVTQRWLAMPTQVAFRAHHLFLLFFTPNSNCGFATIPEQEAACILTGPGADREADCDPVIQPSFGSLCNFLSLCPKHTHPYTTCMYGVEGVRRRTETLLDLRSSLHSES